MADDNRDGADTLAMVLRLRGGKVTTTYNGNAAVEAFTADPMEVVLLDLWMPGRSGWDACRAIRLLPGGTEAMIIAITGGARPEDQVRSREAGFDAHLVKPLDHTALMRLVSP